MEIKKCIPKYDGDVRRCWWIFRFGQSKWLSEHAGCWIYRLAIFENVTRYLLAEIQLVRIIIQCPNIHAKERKKKNNSIIQILESVIWHFTHFYFLFKAHSFHWCLTFEVMRFNTTSYLFVVIESSMQWPFQRKPVR